MYYVFFVGIEPHTLYIYIQGQMFEATYSTTAYIWMIHVYVFCGHRATRADVWSHILYKSRWMIHGMFFLWA